MVVLFLTAVLAFGAFGTRRPRPAGQAVQAIAPVMTVFLFLSSSVNFPRNLIGRLTGSVGSRRSTRSRTWSRGSERAGHRLG